MRAERVLGRWAGNLRRGGSVGDSLAGQEIAQIEQAILKGNERLFDEYGDLQGALKRIGKLKKVLPEGQPQDDHQAGFPLNWLST